jgi:O-acetyl-ADP-ribose deacetylase (regulator of RNase III)
MLNHIKGNLIDMAENGDFDVIVQGCNCFNTMGGGIAREIRERYPLCAEIDSLTQAGEYMKLGNWTEYDQGMFLIINAYTQYDMSKGTDVFEYVAFELILQKLAHTYGTKRFGFPYIGMGLAGGDKITIMAMLETFAREVSNQGGTVTLVEFG